MISGDLNRTYFASSYGSIWSSPSYLERCYISDIAVGRINELSSGILDQQREVDDERGGPSGKEDCSPRADIEIKINNMSTKESRLSSRLNAARVANNSVSPIYSPSTSPKMGRKVSRGENFKNKGSDIKRGSFDKFSSINGHNEMFPNSKLLVGNSLPESLMKILDQGQLHGKNGSSDAYLISPRLERKAFGGSANSLLKLDEQLRGSDVKSTQNKRAARYSCSSPTGFGLNPPTLERSKSMDIDSMSALPIAGSKALATQYLEFIEAKDALIHKKELLIEKQKMTISQHRQKIADLEEKLHKELVKAKSFDNDGEHIEVQLQELNYQNAQLKAQLAENHALHQTRTEALERKLGETEALLLKMEKLCEETTAAQGKELEKYKAKFQDYEEKLHLAREEAREAKEDLRTNRHRSDSMKKYLDELPTKEDLRKALNKIKEQQEKKEELEEKIAHLERKLKESKCLIETKEDGINKEEMVNSELRAEIARLKTVVEKYKKREERGPVSLEELEEVKWELQRTVSNSNMLKKALQNKHKKLEEANEHSKTLQEKLEERLHQEEDTVLALKEEMRKKDVVLEDLKKSTMEVTETSQQLMVENVKLKEEIAEAKMFTNEETQGNQRKLLRELNLCTKELKSFVKLCNNRVEGKEPNLEDLLGVENSGECDGDSETHQQDLFCPDVVKAKTNDIRKLRMEVDRLRSFVSDQYAEDVGNNMCKVQ